MFLHLSDECTQLITAAKEYAAALGSVQLEGVHLLNVLPSKSSGACIRALECVHLNSPLLKETALCHGAVTQEKRIKVGEVQLSYEYHEILGLAEREARKRKQRVVGVDDLALALVNPELASNNAQLVLRHCHVNPTSLRETLLHLLTIS